MTDVSTEQNRETNQQTESEAAATEAPTEAESTEPETESATEPQTEPATEPSEGREVVHEINKEILDEIRHEITFSKFIEGELCYEWSAWYEEYNGEKIQRITGLRINEELWMPYQRQDIIYYRADEGESPESAVNKMIAAMIEPMKENSELRRFTVTDFRLADQKLYQVSDDLWLLLQIDGYWSFDGDLGTAERDYYEGMVPTWLTMDYFKEKYPDEIQPDGLLPFYCYHDMGPMEYVLMRQDGVYRLQSYNSTLGWWHDRGFDAWWLD